MEWVRTHFSAPLQTGHIIWLRATTPWETFHMSVAKNTAHMSGFKSNLTDRLMTIAEAGLTANEADLTARTFLMNWDNDNVLSLRWLYDCLRASNHLVSTTNLNVGYQWQNAHLGTCGRIGTSYEIFKKMGGYDESMLAMGCQDVDLVKRMWLIGCMEHRSGSTSFTVSNRPEEVRRLLSARGAKEKRAEKGKENDEKLKWLPEYEKFLGSFAKICDHNGRVMKLRAQNKIWTVNEGKSIGVSVLRMTISPRLTLDGYEVRWPAVEILNPDPDPQAGFDRHGSSSSAPQPAPASEHTIFQHQVLVVSLGTRTLAQAVPSSNSANEMRRLFWDKGDKVRGATLTKGLARRLIEECYGLEFRDCIFEAIDCRMFHGETYGHVGLHPPYQTEYLIAVGSNRRALQTMCHTLTKEVGAYPLQFKPNNPRLQRVFIFYCNAGEHRSVAFAALCGAMFRTQGAKVRL